MREAERSSSYRIEGDTMVGLNGREGIVSYKKGRNEEMKEDEERKRRREDEKEEDEKEEDGRKKEPILAWASVTAFKKDDFPAEGFPTQAIKRSCIGREEGKRGKRKEKCSGVRQRKRGREMNVEGTQEGSQEREGRRRNNLRNQTRRRLCFFCFFYFEKVFQRIRKGF